MTMTMQETIQSVKRQLQAIDIFEDPYTKTVPDGKLFEIQVKLNIVSNNLEFSVFDNIFLSNFPDTVYFSNAYRLLYMGTPWTKTIHQSQKL